jgi:hypothetical protein
MFFSADRQKDFLRVVILPVQKKSVILEEIIISYLCMINQDLNFLAPQKKNICGKPLNTFSVLFLFVFHVLCSLGFCL